MVGLLSRSKAICTRNWGFRIIVPGSQKSPQIVLKNVVMSGFPTALEPALRRLSLGTHASPQPSDRKAGPLLVPRVDIPRPPPVVVVLGVCCLRLARIYGSSYPSSSLKGAVWEGRTEFFLGGIKKSIVREGSFVMMCDLQRMKSGKKPAAGLNHFSPILRKPPM